MRTIQAKRTQRIMQAAAGETGLAEALVLRRNALIQVVEDRNPAMAGGNRTSETVLGMSGNRHYYHDCHIKLVKS